MPRCQMKVPICANSKCRRIAEPQSTAVRKNPKNISPGYCGKSVKGIAVWFTFIWTHIFVIPSAFLHLVYIYILYIYIFISHMIAIYIAIFCWTCSFSQNWSAHWEPSCGFCDDKVVQGQAHALGGDPFRTAWCNGVQRYKRLTFGPFWQ